MFAAIRLYSVYSIQPRPSCGNGEHDTSILVNNYFCRGHSYKLHNGVNKRLTQNIIIKGKDGRIIIVAQYIRYMGAYNKQLYT